MADLAERAPEQIREAIAEARASGNTAALRTIIGGLKHAMRWTPLPHQIPPADEDWYVWLLLGGRFAGKSATGAKWLSDHMLGPPCNRASPGGHYGMIIGQTISTAAEAAWASPASIRTHCPEARLIGSSVGGAKIRWPNGAEARLFGASSPDDVEHLRGGGANRCAVWADELAAWRHLDGAWTQIGFAARGKRPPKIVATTTPRPRTLIRRLLAASQKPEPKLVTERVVLSRASSRDNPYIAADLVEALYAQYGHSQLGRQELDAELVENIEGALWRADQLEVTRREDLAYQPIQDVLDVLRIQKVYVGIDPSTWGPDTNDDPGTVGEGIETGIVTVGVDDQRPAHLWVLGDASGRLGPEAWAQASAAEWAKWRALALVPERNLGAMVMSTIRLVAPDVPIYREGNKPGIWAKTGKRVRAEPVAALSGDPTRPETWGQGRLHMVGRFPELEAQMTLWDASEGWSPDRLDALVYACQALNPALAQGMEVVAAQVARTRIPGLGGLGGPRG